MSASHVSAHHAFASHHATFNHVWSSLLLEELFRLGVRDIALASGSRSAPLTMPAAAPPGFRRHLHLHQLGSALPFIHIVLCQRLLT